MGENQDHPNSYSKHYQGVKQYFSAEAASTVRQRPAQGMPGPQLTSLCLSGARPPRSAPRPPPLRPLPPPAGRSPPGVRLPSLLQFGDGMWGCSGCCRHRLHCHRSAARRAAGAGSWGPAGSPEARDRGAAGPRRGKLSARGAVRAGSEPPAPK